MLDAAQLFSGFGQFQHVSISRIDLLPLPVADRVPPSCLYAFDNEGFRNERFFH